MIGSLNYHWLDQRLEIVVSLVALFNLVLAPSLRTIVHLRVLNLSGCDLTAKGAYITASFLKSLAVQRQADQWVWSLRESPLDAHEAHLEPSRERPRPLKRLIMCNNRLKDEGCDILLDLFREQVGLVAMDLQYNQLTDKSGKAVQNILGMNTSVVVLDLRNNDIGDSY